FGSLHSVGAGYGGARRAHPARTACIAGSSRRWFHLGRRHSSLVDFTLYLSSNNMIKCAFVFPGQGSQSRGMMNGYSDFAAVRDTFTEASDVLKQDLWQLVAEGSDADLNATVNTQPIMLTAGMAVYRAWQSRNGLAPAIMAGHSLGEYT